MPRTLDEIMKDELKLSHYCVLDQDFDDMDEVKFPELEEELA